MISFTLNDGCRMLLDAVSQPGSDSKELMLHGQEIANVVLVGVVEELSEGAMIAFTLNDGSGRLKVRHYQTSENEKGIDGIAAGRYVSVVGMLRPSPALHVSAMSLRAVTSADEISYHTIEVAHVALTMKRGGSRAPAPTLAPQSIASQPAAISSTQTSEVARTVAPIPEVTPVGGAKTLKESILAVLHRESERVEGVPLAMLCEQVKGSTESEVKAALDELVNDAEVFNTIDDMHFQAL